MTDNVPPPDNSYTVTAQQQTMQPGLNGQFVRGIEVFFQTNRGVSGSVFVPSQLYSVDTVRRAIQARVAELHAVQSLTS